MPESRPSRTCLYVAAARALGAREPDPSVRNPDHLAERLMGPEERALVSDQACVQALDQDYAEAFKNIEAMGSALMMQVRTRFIDERLTDLIAKGAKQLVILGAGFDTRAYRLTELLKDVRIFEVDQPPTQEYKRRRIRETGIAMPPNLTYVPVDFRHDKLDDALHATGYDSSLMTFFIWEGVTMYLTDAAMEETCRWIGAQASGSVVVFDYVYRAVIDWIANIAFDSLPEPTQKAVTRIRSLEAGEPWLFGIVQDTEADFLKNFGLTLTQLMLIGGEESRKLYLTRSDGTFYIPLPPGMERPPAGAAANASYSLAEARV